MADDTDDPHRRALLTLADDPDASPAPMLPPGEVRRRGGRRRIRRRLAVSGMAVATAAAVVLGVGPALVGRPAGPPVTSTPTVASPSTPPTASDAAPRVIDYGANGVSITDPTQVDRLVGSPADFTAFVASIARPDQGCEMVEVTVYRVRTDGFAAGAFTSCGGYQTIWAAVDGRWQEVLGTQDIWTCADLQRFGIPDSVAGGECYDEGRREVIGYEQP